MHFLRRIALGLQGTTEPVAKPASACGFTLVELLVVMGVMGILTALLFPAFARGRERGRTIACLSNLRQVGVVTHFYIQENGRRYPFISGEEWQSFRYGGGDPDPEAARRFGLEPATKRPFWRYTHSRELFRCPADKGMSVIPWMEPFSSNYRMLGTSYKYNDSLWSGSTLVPQKDPAFGIAGKKENWVSQPARFILFHEPPATPYWDGGWFYFFWHYARGPNTRFNLNQVTDRFISSALFADGHASENDFTGPITGKPDFPFEPTPDWYLYEPAVQGR